MLTIAMKAGMTGLSYSSVVRADKKQLELWMLWYRLCWSKKWRKRQLQKLVVVQLLKLLLGFVDFVSTEVT